MCTQDEVIREQKKQGKNLKKDSRKRKAEKERDRGKTGKNSVP